jgi:hypothetical protein
MVSQVSSRRVKPRVEELLSRGEFELRRDFGAYSIDGKRINAKTFELVSDALDSYLSEYCEKVDEYTYDVGEEMPRDVELYNCPIGKVGVSKASAEHYDITRVFVGNDGWKKAKEDALEELRYELEQVEEGSEWYTRFQEDIENIEKMPE